MNDHHARSVDVYDAICIFSDLYGNQVTSAVLDKESKISSYIGLKKSLFMLHSLRKQWLTIKDRKCN